MNAEGTSSKFGSKKGRKLVDLTKKKIMWIQSANPTVTYEEEIGKKFGIGKSTVGDIMQVKEKWLAITEGSADAIKLEDAC